MCHFLLTGWLTRPVSASPLVASATTPYAVKGMTSIIGINTATSVFQKPKPK